MLRRLSIRALVGGTVGVMGVLLILMAGFNLLSAFQGNYAAQRAVSLATVDTDVFDALLAFRLERGTMLGALVAPGPSDDVAIARLTDNRKLSEASYAQAALRLADAARANPELADLTARLSAAHDAMTTLRAQTDAMIRQAKPARAAETVQSASPTSLAYQDALVLVGDKLEAAMKLISPQIDQLLAIKWGTWSARLAAGNQAVRTESAVASARAWQLPDYVGAAEDRGAMRLALSQISEIAARPEIPQPVVEAVATAGAVFPEVFTAEQADIVKSLADNSDAPVIALPALQKRHGQQFGLLNDIATLTLRETHDLAANQATESYRTLVLSGMALLLALVLTPAGLLIISRRVSIPIAAMTRAMRLLAGHDLSTVVPGMDRGDEIGGMAAAVQVFKETMIRADRLAAEREAEQLEKMVRAQRLSNPVGHFEHRVSGMVSTLSSASTVMVGTARSITEAAARTNSKAEPVAVAAEESNFRVRMA